jgi:hypothetical protein
MTKIVFAFGRFQPPTIGHKLLIDTTKLLAKQHSADYAIYVSKTKDYTNNPLSIEQKMEYLPRMFPATNFVACNNEVRTFVEAAKYLNKQYDELVMIAGSDRVQAFENILHNCNGKDFQYRSIEVVSAGVRNNNANGIAGISGTKVRKAAIDNDFKAFYQGLPNTISEEDALLLMKNIQTGLIRPARKRVTCCLNI